VCQLAVDECDLTIALKSEQGDEIIARRFDVADIVDIDSAT
jgi:hypothetical protein